MRDYIVSGNGKRVKEAMADMIAFANGDSTQESVVHWCLAAGNNRPACCQGDSEALTKLLSHLVPFFSKGYDCPLLYRMKHFGQASSYIKFACCFFNILPRALAELGEARAKDATTSLADAFLAETGLQTVEADFEQLLADAIDADTDWAAQNGLRLKKVVAEVAKPMFYQGSLVVDALIRPIEIGINMLLSHTHTMHDLVCVGRGHPQHVQLRESASQKFLSVMRGELGEKLVREYYEFFTDGLLEAIEMGLDLDAKPGLLDQIFQVATCDMTDLHRRFCHDFWKPPYSLLALADVPHDEFVAKWGAFQDQYSRCKQCLDADFGAVLMNHFHGDIRVKPVEEQTQMVNELQSLFRDICQWGSLTSDMVELKHGQVQWSVSRRGSQNTKAPRAALETSLLQAAVKQNFWCQMCAGHQSLPPRKVSAGIRKMVGVSSTNHLSRKDWPRLRLSHVVCDSAL